MLILFRKPSIDVNLPNATGTPLCDVCVCVIVFVLDSCQQTQITLGMFQQPFEDDFWKPCAMFHGSHAEEIDRVRQREQL